MRWESIHYADSRLSQSESAEPVEPVHDLPTSALATSHRTQASRESISGWVLIARPDNSYQGHRLIPHILFHTTTELPDTGCSPSIRRCTEYQPLPPQSVSGIAIRDRSHTQCNWGQNWGHNSIFAGCNYRFRAKSKCSLATLRVFRRCREGVHLILSPQPVTVTTEVYSVMLTGCFLLNFTST